MKLPDFIIIGETKCGTTSLYNYLIQHPRVLENRGNGDKEKSDYSTKEIRFFDRYFNRGIEWYMNCFPDTPDGYITGEATPMYMYRTMVLERIYSITPHSKLIVILRNPVDRLYSHFNHMTKWNPSWHNKYLNFKDYLNATREEDYYLIDKGLYFYTLQKWFNLFPKEQFIILSTEELNLNTQFEINKAYLFLGLEKNRLKEKRKYRESAYPKMDKKIRQNLIEFYKPYNNSFYDLIERSMPWDV